MKTIDLRHQQLSADELLQAAGSDSLRITTKDGDEFILEPADAFAREAAEFGRSAKFLAFLAERSAESGRTPLSKVELRLGATDPPTRD